MRKPLLGREKSRAVGPLARAVDLHLQQDRLLDKFNHLLTNATHDDPGTQRRITQSVTCPPFPDFLEVETILGGIEVSSQFWIDALFYPTPGS